jgi:hypothetical protein
MWPVVDCKIYHQQRFLSNQDIEPSRKFDDFREGGLDALVTLNKQ